MTVRRRPDPGRTSRVGTTGAANPGTSTRFITRLGITVAPLLITVLFTVLVTAGYVAHNPQQRILLIAVPLVWSLAFLLCNSALWSQGAAAKRGASISAGFATGLAALTWVILSVFTWLLPG